MNCEIQHRIQINLRLPLIKKKQTFKWKKPGCNYLAGKIKRVLFDIIYNAIERWKSFIKNIDGRSS